MNLDDLNHDEIRRWLEHALRGSESLPRLTPDEAPHLAILRLERTLQPHTRRSLQDGAIQLLREFCVGSVDKAEYLEELIAIGPYLGGPEAVHLLAELAAQSDRFGQVPSEIRPTVLGALVDGRPPQSAEFWRNVLRQDPERYAALALSGLLVADHWLAVKELCSLPDSVRLGKAAALKLDLTWDALPPEQRPRFVQEVAQVLPGCKRQFAAPVRTWLATKQPQDADQKPNPGLRNALRDFFGGDTEVEAKYRTTKLCGKAA